jgi:hypothetical protein
LRRHQNQPWALACHFRLRGAAEGVKDSDHGGVGCHNSQCDRTDYGKAEYQRDEERNHVSTNPYKRNMGCCWRNFRLVESFADGA